MPVGDNVSVYKVILALTVHNKLSTLTRLLLDYLLINALIVDYTKSMFLG